MFFMVEVLIIFFVEVWFIIFIRKKNRKRCCCFFGFWILIIRGIIIKNFVFGDNSRRCVRFDFGYIVWRISGISLENSIN